MFTNKLKNLCRYWWSFMLPGFSGMLLGYYTGASRLFLGFCVGLFVAGFSLVLLDIILGEAESAGLNSKRKD